MVVTSQPLLARYAGLLRQWNDKINLVGPTTIDSLETRHLADCAQLLDYLPAQPSQIADIGSGAGLPGLVLAILAPHHQYSLIESDTRKAAFLQTVQQNLNLDHVKVYPERVENLTLPQPIDFITARAFAPLPRLLPQTQHLLAKNGCWLLLKGEAVDVELKACGTLFPMTVRTYESKVPASDGGKGVVVQIYPER